MEDLRVYIVRTLCAGALGGLGVKLECKGSVQVEIRGFRRVCRQGNRDTNGVCRLNPLYWSVKGV